jgi:hypothetical protein
MARRRDSRATQTQAAAARPARRQSMARRQEPHRLRQLPRAPHGAGRWRSGESPADSDTCRAPQTATVDGAAARRLRQLQRAPHGAVGCCSGKSPADSDSYRAPRTAPVDGAAVRAPQAQAAAARPAWRRSMAQRKSPADSDSCRAPRTAPVDGAAARALKTQAAEARPGPHTAPVDGAAA